MQADTGISGLSALCGNVVLPSSFANLQLWLQSDRGVLSGGGAAADGALVDTWNDQSGNANNATQATSSKKPTFHSNLLNGLGGVQFDGVAGTMSIADAAGLHPTSAATIFALYQTHGNGTYQAVYCKGNTSTPDYGLLSNWGGGGHSGGLAHTDSSTAWRISNDNVFRYDLPQLVEVLWDGTNYTFTVNGAAAGVVAGANFKSTADSLWLAQQGNAADDNGFLTLYALLIYNAALSSAQRQQVRNYLYQTFGLAKANYVLFYNGTTAPGGGYKIGRADWPSAEAGANGGGTANRSFSNPLLGSGNPSNKDPCVLYDAGTWKMWYTITGSGIGYATSSDGTSWTASGSNPVLTPSGMGWDSGTVSFPVVYKDAGAPAGKRYRMLYSGSSGSNYQIGYAYSADGVTWTKGGSNPVLANGSGGQFDDTVMVAGCLAKSGGTYYFLYGGEHHTPFPEDDQVGGATFTDFEGAYTKSGGNPILAKRSSAKQALTADLASGGTSVTVASSAAFAVGEAVVITNDTTIWQTRILSIPNGTTINLWSPSPASLTVASGSTILSVAQALTPRALFLDGSTWKMLLSGFQVGVNNPKVETTAYAESSNTTPDSGWAFQWGKTPPLWLPQRGVTGPWDAESAENVCIVLDASTYLPYLQAAAPT
jgi:hypothetical protein